MPPVWPEDQKALQSIIARFDPSLQGRVFSGGDFELQLDYLIDQRNPPLPDNDRKSLRLLRTLWPVTGKNPCILDHLAACREKLFTFADIAEQCYAFPTEWRGYNYPEDYHGYKFTDIELAPLRMYFYDMYPALVLRGLIETGTIPCKPEEMKPFALLLFSAAIDEGVDITNTSTLDLTTGFLERQTEQDRSLALQTVRFFQAIQRLQAIVITVDQIAPLLSSNLISAQDIAYKDIQELKEACPNLERSVLRKIQDRALVIATRNEQAWVYLLKTRLNDLEPVSVTEASKETQLQRSDQISLQTLFNEVNTAGCEHCCSVLSPSAYFVDLLRMLSTIKASDGETLQKKLFDRRKDLAYLELSCANTNDLIQYIDLVHETLQAFSVNLAIDKREITTRDTMNMIDKGDVYFDHDLHLQVLSKIVYPIDSFPYNYATSSIDHYLRTVGTSRLGVARTFQSKYRIFDTTETQKAAIKAIVESAAPDTAASKPDLKAAAQSANKLFKLAESVNRRAITAHSLGLRQEEYVLLTGEAYYSRSAVEVCNGLTTPEEYLRLTEQRSVGQLWGYADDKEMLSEDESTKIGLSFVEAQFLPRSGLSLDELVEVLQTQYMSCRLILTPANATKKFVKSLTALRLRSLPSVNNTSNSLDAQLCRDLLNFIRLYRKLEWSISDLDATLSCLWRDQALPASNESIHTEEQQILGSRLYQAMTTDLLENISAIKQLSKVTGIAVLQLLTLWGRMDAFGPNSLYSTLFLQGRSASDLEIFGSNVEGDFFRETPTVGDGLVILSTAMSLSRLEFGELLAATGVDRDTLLTMSVISQIYRYMLLGKILQTTFPKLKQLLKQPSFSQLFDGPISTLRILSEWNKLAALGWTIDDILQVCLPMEADIKAHRGDRGSIPGIVAALCTTISSRDSAAKSALNEDDLAREVVMAAIRLQNTNVAESTLQVLVDDVLRFTDSNLQVVTSAQYLDEALKLSNFEQMKHAYLVAPESGTYMFSSSMGSLVIDETPLVTLSPQEGWHADTLTLKKGEAYSIAFGDEANLEKGTPVPGGQGRWFKRPKRDLQELKWRCVHQPSLAPLATFLAAKGTVQRLQEIVSVSTATIKLVTQFKLEEDEIRYFVQAKALGSSISLQHPTFANIQTLQKYFSLRRSIRMVSKNENRLLRFLRWCNDSTSIGSISFQIAELTSSSTQRVSDILDHSYPRVPEEMRRILLRDVEELDKLLSIWSFFSTTKLSITDESLLFDIAQPAQPNQRGQEFKLATNLRNDLRRKFEVSDETKTTSYTTVVRKIVQECRSALIQYLINHPSKETKPFIDADTLFEYFLIDVSMGPGLETSRIKQAISTIHLYVQRCILGLEAANKVSNNVINRKIWEWMRSYQTWEANRKVFLYPENWLDPTLRDDKSDLFKDFEAKIMQTNLDLENVTQLTKAYVYGLNDLCDLEVQSYLWDTQSSNKKTFHLFARTRNTPYIYYYRRLTVSAWRYKDGSATEIIPESRLLRWTPWQRLDMEIQTFETDADGKPLAKPGTYLIPAIRKDRLFLFNPQILVKVKPNTMVQESSISSVGNMKAGESAPSKYWEIRMSWTELRNGQWSAKKISQASLTVEPLPSTSLPGGSWVNAPDMDANRLPSIDSFKFWIRSADSFLKPVAVASGVQDMLIIDVESTFTIFDADSFKVGAFSLGRFEMREYDITTRSATEVSGNWNLSSKWDDRFKEGLQRPIPTIRTRFSKVIDGWQNSADNVFPSENVGHSGLQNKPLFGATKWESGVWRSNTWVMSFDDTQAPRATGLVIDANIWNQGSLRYIFLPNDDYANNKDSGTAMQTINRMGPYLMENATSMASIDKLYSAFSEPNKELNVDTAFGGSKDPVFHEQATPYALYHWELGYHLIALLMERFLATQQLEMALQVARYVFDPTVPGGDTTLCWRFPPFRNPALVNKESPAQIVEKLDPVDGSNFISAVDEWRDSPFSPHVVARNYPKAYMKRIVRKYIEILIASGDQYFRQGTLESLPLAIQQYVEASHLFGGRPATFNSLSKSKPRTFASLSEGMFNSFNNSEVDLELSFPFKRLPKLRDQGSNAPGSDAAGLMGILQTGYFCVPANPELVRLRDLIDDRLYKIRNCQDINGKGVRLRLFEPALDPGALIQAQAAGISISSFLTEREGAMVPKSRFSFLLAKALEICAELKTMGDEYLSIKEKRDAEALMALRQSQECSVTNMARELKTLQRDEAYKTLESLEETRHGHVTRLSFYLQLAGEDVNVPKEGQEWSNISQDIEPTTNDDLRMSRTEKLEVDRANDAAGFYNKASILETTAGVLAALPRMVVNTAPVGVGISVHWDGSVWSQLLMTTAGVLKIIGQMKTDESVRAQRRAQLMRQLQERRMQANMAGRDIAVLDKQIAAQKIRVKLSESDLRVHEKQIEHAKELETWYRTKYTNEKLYAWMDNTFCKIYQDTYELAYSMARTAQQSFEFESQDPNQRKYLKATGYWDRSKDGLYSARNLYLDLKRTEWQFLNNRYHDFEITKTVSLRQIDPYQLLRLKYEHAAEFSLTEMLFDADFPGQYRRRLKSVAVSIPCIVGPYTSISCTLTLKNSEIRIDPWTRKDEKEGDRKDMSYVPIKSIAVSHGQADNGMFEMSFGGNGDRYGPFEGAGAMSSWLLQLPSPVPQFDYTTITDVILHLRYTSKEATETSQTQATQRVQQFMSQAANTGAAPTSLFDIKNDYPNEWRFLTRPRPGSTELPTETTLSLNGILHRLPFWTKGRTVTAKKTTLVVTTEDGNFPDIFLNNGLEFAALGDDKNGARTLENTSSVAIKDDWSLTVKRKAPGMGTLNGMFMVVSYTVSGLGP